MRYKPLAGTGNRGYLREKFSYFWRFFLKTRNLAELLYCGSWAIDYISLFGLIMAINVTKEKYIYHSRKNFWYQEIFLFRGKHLQYCDKRTMRYTSSFGFGNLMRIFENEKILLSSEKHPPYCGKRTMRYKSVWLVW